MIRRHGHPPSSDQIELFLEIGRRLDRRRFIAANDGNMSLLDEDGSLVVTATGARKGYLRPEDIVRVDRNGQLLSGVTPPSSELEMHLAVYEARPDVVAVVHAHPITATAFAVARQPLDQCVLPEIILTLGSIPIAPYATPGTDELAASIRGLIQDHDAILLANHGAIAVAGSRPQKARERALEDAYFTLERVEHSAQILLSAQLLGSVTQLPREDVARLMATGPESVHGTIPCVPGPRSESDPAAAAGSDTGPGAATDRPSVPVAAEPHGMGVLDRDGLAALITDVLRRRGIGGQGPSDSNPHIPEAH